MRLIPVNKETPVSFVCQTCGECCSGTMRVRLNPEDLWRIARFLDIDHTRELFDRGYVHWRRGPGGYEAPFLHFKRRPFPFCPFLENRLSGSGGIQGLCRLHPDNKPLICALSPAGRSYNTANNTEQFYYLPPHAGCPGHDKGFPAPLAELINPLSDRLARENTLFARLDKLNPLLNARKVRELYLFKVTDQP
jgi:Fe-S-cluster containining protein